MKFKCKKRDTTDCTKWLCDVDNCKKYDPIKANNQPEPTTAEMLLWLAKNTNIGITKTCMFVNIKTYVWDNGTAEILAKRGQKAIMVKELDEAIKFAYLKKQEEQNAKN